MSTIRDASLAPLGRQRIQWVREFMPVLTGIEADFAKKKPFAGLRIAVCVHMEAKTAYLALVLRAGGAEVCATGSNPLSTKDDICAALDGQGVEIHGWFGATEEEYREHLRRTLEFCPHIIIDDGGDLVAMLLNDHPEYARNLIGGCEETTTGVHRLRGLSAAGKLPFPMLDVNDADSK
ncbi:MAG: adenosylhomocysteinase, partial [Clostridia bacterium]|nr:adenosylhomocysteinase [Clostridia bacterium]